MFVASNGRRIRTGYLTYLGKRLLFLYISGLLHRQVRGGRTCYSYLQLTDRIESENDGENLVTRARRA